MRRLHHAPVLAWLLAEMALCPQPTGAPASPYPGRNDRVAIKAKSTALRDRCRRGVRVIA